MLFGKRKLVVPLVLALGLVGSATALFGERSPAPSPDAGPAKEAPKKEEVSPDEVRAGLELLIDPLVGKLHEAKPWGGLEADKNTTLGEALGQISKAWDRVPFDIDEMAFKTDDLDKVLTYPIVSEEGIEGGVLKLATILKRALGRLPAKSGATYLIRRDHIEITTNAAVRAELGLPKDRPVPPLFTRTLLKRPLSDALDLVAELTDTNVLLDGRVANKVKDVRVSARLANVPVETAVRLLADMAGLGVVRQANVLYVTTPENAARLLAENERKAR